MQQEFTNSVSKSLSTCIVDCIARDCAALGMQCAPFDTADYGRILTKYFPGGSQRGGLPWCDESLFVILLISSEEFFYRVVVPHSGVFASNCVDSTVNFVLERLRRKYSEISQVFNTDVPPYVHVQSLGMMTGLARFIHPSVFSRSREELAASRDECMWPPSVIGTPLGLSLHHTRGGYFAYRGLLVTRREKNQSGSFSAAVESSRDRSRESPELENFVGEAVPPPGSKFVRAINEFNLRPMSRGWRGNARGAFDRYQLKFFSDSSKVKRRALLAFLHRKTVIETGIASLLISVFCGRVVCG